MTCPLLLEKCDTFARFDSPETRFELALDALHDYPGLLAQDYPEHAADLATALCALIAKYRDKHDTMADRMAIGEEAQRLVDAHLIAAARSAV